MEQVLSSSMVADPLRLLHCSPVSDGAAAVLLCPLSEARNFTDRPVLIAGSGIATGSMALADREEISELDAVKLAAERAYAMADRIDWPMSYCRANSSISTAPCTLSASPA